MAQCFFFFFFFLNWPPQGNFLVPHGMPHLSISFFFKPQIVFPNTLGNSQWTLPSTNRPILNDSLMWFLSQSHSSLTFHPFSGLIVTFLFSFFINTILTWSQGKMDFKILSSTKFFSLFHLYFSLIYLVDEFQFFFFFFI